MTVDPGDGLVAVLSSLGLKLINVVVGAVASFCALRFFDGLSKTDKWSTFVGGWAIAAWGGPPLVAMLDFHDKIHQVEVAFVLLLGFFGMALAAEIIKLIRTTDWGLLLREAFDSVLRWIRRDRP